MRDIDDLWWELHRRGVFPRTVTHDSRQVQPGTLFLAWPGGKTDGRNYLSEALAAGAEAVLYEAGDGWVPPADLTPVRPLIAVEGLRSLAGPLADRVYGSPSQSLWVAGVTGTNGKTTTSQWLAQALDALGVPCGVIGTLGCGRIGRLEDQGFTTPEAPQIHAWLRGFLDAGCVAAVMEVSSIGLVQDRVAGVRFDVAIFTNLTRDHLDYHGSMEAYAAAKRRLFECPDLQAAVLDVDDPVGETIARECVSRGLETWAVSLRGRPMLPGVRPLWLAQPPHEGTSGQRLTLALEGRTLSLHLPAFGTFNASNALLVLGALLARGVELDRAVGVLGRLVPPPGRMQWIGGVAEPLVVIDYAHTPVALEQVISALMPTARSRGGRLVVVFGCGGDRDRGKRPLMGAVAAQADAVIVTSDNPRSEPPEAILADILAGIGRTDILVEPDRAKAIAQAIEAADADDVILLAGKGHEPYQEIAGVRHPFSDQAEAEAALARWRERNLFAELS
ncbi:UDP-N-acetylmuramoyl-L-alanyl-D-glutamate--2,6-diaminopimelate ligase [Tepidiphilus olei]|uniref:UDP-N-acetylmuramoyl-L-alanyl-D-glutamate--2, 6-diaminopimelate ligase n=1 Tax=Tepidiphilus olei TaxID=2502184 RepID=UPI00115C5A99|nr:UDP-N-acetylmuramoyl-L-alanyl-D-glutamate--2,6-diaminopimelate ligase [Tepidiphilus olei]